MTTCIVSKESKSNRELAAGLKVKRGIPVLVRANFCSKRLRVLHPLATCEFVDVEHKQIMILVHRQLLLPVALLSVAACTNKSKTSDSGVAPAAQATPARTAAPKETTIPPESTVLPPAQSPAPAPGPTRKELNLPPSNVQPLNAQNLLLQLPELSRLTYLWSLSPLTPAGLPLSDLESKAESCAQKATQTVSVQATETTLSFKSTVDFGQCLNEVKPVLSAGSTTWKTTFSWNFNASCANHDLKRYDGLTMADPDFVRYLCFDATSGEIQSTLIYEVTEQNAAGTNVRAFKRTRGILNSIAESETKGCKFNAAENVRTYDSCLMFDKIEDATGSAVRYLEASFEANKVVSKFDSKGQKFFDNGTVTQTATQTATQSTTTPVPAATSGIKLQINNWKGELLAPTDINSAPSYKLSDGVESLDGSQAFPWPQEYSNTSKIFK